MVTTTTAVNASKKKAAPSKADVVVDEIELKKEKRRAANRKSARKSRYRENVMIDELQRNSQELAARKLELEESNATLRKAIASIKDSMKKSPPGPHHHDPKDDMIMKELKPAAAKPITKLFSSPVQQCQKHQHPAEVSHWFVKTPCLCG